MPGEAILLEFDASAGIFGWPPALIASIIAALVASVGIVAVTSLPDLANRHRPTLAALASGVLLGTAMFLLPEAYAGSEFAPLVALFGYFTFFVIGRFARRPEGRAITAFLAIAAHSAIDGIGYGLLFSASETAGILGSFGLIIHEFSEGIILYLIVRSVGMSRLVSASLALLGAAATTPLGTLASLTVIPNLNPEELALGLSFAAGALLFVGASQLPEEFGDLRLRPAVVAYAFGAALAVLMMWTLHDHDHGVAHDDHEAHETHDDHDDHGDDDHDGHDH